MQSQSTLKDQGNYGDNNKTGMYTFYMYESFASPNLLQRMANSIS